MVCASELVSEVLGEDNYEHWCSSMQRYLVAKDLWEVVENNIEPENEHIRASAKWRQMNAMALHLIHISCSPEMVFQIRDDKDAKKAWDRLASLHNPSGGSLADGQSEVPSPSVAEPGKYKHLIKALYRGNWHAIERFLDDNPEALTAEILVPGLTALQVAIHAQHVEVFQKLVGRVGAEGLEVREKLSGMTSLAMAASGGNVQIAKCIVENNSRLVSIRDESDLLPVVHASKHGHKKMTRYLYSITPKEELHPSKGASGHSLLVCCTLIKVFDVATDLLKKHPSLLNKQNPMVHLSCMPSAFESGYDLLFWQRWIYSWIPVPQDVSDPTHVSIQQSGTDEYDGGNIRSQRPSLLHGLVLLKPLGLVLLKPLGTNKIYDKKLMHTQALQLVSYICKEFGNTPMEASISQAVKNGIVEIIVEMIKASPQLLWGPKPKMKDLFFTAIQNRQENIFNLLYTLDPVTRMMITSSTTKGSSNMLHMAAMLPPPHRLDGISGAALQMQRELQWFQEVESIIEPIGKHLKNEEGNIPSDLFTKTHAKMLKEGENWMKEIAKSSTVVVALILTVTFAAVFTIPGGNKEGTGTPIFSGDNLFRVFIIFDLISFFFATTSLLVFLGILTSRYEEKKFLIELPTKLIIGLFFLFVSVMAMVITFGATLVIILRGEGSRGLIISIISIILLPCILVRIFQNFQFPLFREILQSTYGPSIFNKKINLWC